MNILSKLLFALRKFWLRQRIRVLGSGFAINSFAASEFQKEVAQLNQALEEAEDDDAEASTALATLERYISQIEAGFLPSTAASKEANEDIRLAITSYITGRRLFVMSIFVWLLLITSNWISLLSTTYSWPIGWFANDRYTGFALVGATLNSLFSLVQPDPMEQGRRYPFSLYAFRLLQATVYVAVLYHVASLFLPDSQIACAQQLCVSLQSPLLLVLSFFIGLVVSPIEKGILWLFDIEGRRKSREAQSRQLHDRYVKLFGQYREMMIHPENPVSPKAEIEGRFRRIRKAIEFNLPKKAATMLLDLELDIYKLAYIRTNQEEQSAPEGQAVHEVRSAREGQSALEEQPAIEVQTTPQVQVLPEAEEQPTQETKQKVSQEEQAAESK